VGEGGEGFRHKAGIAARQKAKVKRQKEKGKREKTVVMSLLMPCAFFLLP
jgi:hypothetical protein